MLNSLKKKIVHELSKFLKSDKWKALSSTEKKTLKGTMQFLDTDLGPFLKLIK